MCRRYLQTPPSSSLHYAHPIAPTSKTSVRIHRTFDRQTIPFLKMIPLSNNQLPDASLWRRFAAWVYDLFLLFAVAFAYGGIVTIVLVSLGAEPNNLSVVEVGEDMTLVENTQNEFSPFLQGAAFQAGLILVLAAFYVGFWIKRGATLGMQTWRIELVDLEGFRPNIGTCILRCFAATASFLFFGLGYFWSLYDVNNRTAHDILTKTRVVVHPKQNKTS